MVVHRLGRPGVLDPVGVGADEVWQWDHALALLTAPGGYLDHVPAGVPAVLALCGLEEQPDSVGLFDFTARAMADPRLPLVLFCHRDERGLSLRAACRREAGDDDDGDGGGPDDGACDGACDGGDGGDGDGGGAA